MNHIEEVMRDDFGDSDGEKDSDHNNDKTTALMLVLALVPVLVLVLVLVLEFDGERHYRTFSGSVFILPHIARGPILLIANLT